MESLVKLSAEKLKPACEKVIKSIDAVRERKNKEFEEEWLRNKNFFRWLTFRKPLQSVAREEIIRSLSVSGSYRYPSLIHWHQYEIAERLLHAVEKSVDGVVLVSLDDYYYIQDYL
jgi:hypothetical protein